MIEETIVYTVKCNRCGASVFDETEWLGFNDEGYVLDSALEAGWVFDNNNHYCPDCYEYDDEDVLVIKSK